MLLSPSMVAMLNKQVAHEMTNETKYRSVVTWFEDQNLHGWSGFFKKQADGEYEHRGKIIDYMHDKNAHVTYLPVPQVDLAFGDLHELVNFYYMTEIGTTQLLYRIAEAALAEGDFSTFQWINSFLIPEQVEEEGLALDMQSRIARITGPDGQILGLALEELDDELAG
jgi:ferritin